MLTLHDALSHTKNALCQLRAAQATARHRVGSPAPDQGVSRDLLARSLHELTSAAEAVRERLDRTAPGFVPPGSVVSIEAQVEQPEKTGDRMTRYQRAQFGIAPIDPSSLDVDRAFAPLPPLRREAHQNARSIQRPPTIDLRAPVPLAGADKAEHPRP